jgi:hypothetical protein
MAGKYEVKTVIEQHRRGTTIGTWMKMYTINLENKPRIGGKK